MQRFRKFAADFGLQHAIVLAPMAGSTTPALVAAVSNAGGLGSLGAGYMTPEEIVKAVAEIRSLTSRPFAVNLFAGGTDGAGNPDPSRMRELLAPYHARLGLPAPGGELNPPPEFDRQIEAVIDLAVPVFSFTFGIPRRELLGQLRQRGTRIIGTATSVAEARALSQAGVDAISAQGSEAGGHRGTFAGPPEHSLIGTIALVPQIADAVALPVIAAGGIMDGRAIAACAALGASAVQMGTAFLVCPEASLPAPHKTALLRASADTTVLTRAFTGRLARSIPNTFTQEMEGRESAFLPYPRQHLLTRPMRAAAAAHGDGGLLSLWAGQAAPMAREMPAVQLVARLVAETDAALAALGGQAERLS